MAILSEKDQELLRERLAKELQEDVKLIHITHREPRLFIPGVYAPYAREARLLMEELVTLSPKLYLEVYDYFSDTQVAAQYRTEGVPLTVLSVAGDGRVRHYGIPAGREFDSFIEAIVDTSRGEAELSPEILAQLAQIQEPVSLRVFVTPT